MKRISIILALFMAISTPTFAATDFGCFRAAYDGAVATFGMPWGNHNSPFYWETIADDKGYYQPRPRRTEEQITIYEESLDLHAWRGAIYVSLTPNYLVGIQLTKNRLEIARTMHPMSPATNHDFDSSKPGYDIVGFYNAFNLAQDSCNL